MRRRGKEARWRGGELCFDAAWKGDSPHLDEKNKNTIPQASRVYHRLTDLSLHFLLQWTCECGHLTHWVIDDIIGQVEQPCRGDFSPRSLASMPPQASSIHVECLYLIFKPG